MDSYSRGTEVDIKAPTQRSLCFFLWFMYCKILKKKLVVNAVGAAQPGIRSRGCAVRSRWDLHLPWENSTTASPLGSVTLFSQREKGRQGTEPVTTSPRSF